MWKKICFGVVTINYFIGVGASIYLIGKFLNKLFNFNGGTILVIVLQCILFYCLTEFEKFIKENAIEEYKRNHNIKL